MCRDWGKWYLDLESCMPFLFCYATLRSESIWSRVEPGLSFAIALVPSTVPFASTSFNGQGWTRVSSGFFLMCFCLFVCLCYHLNSQPSLSPAPYRGSVFILFSKPVPVLTTQRWGGKVLLYGFGQASFWGKPCAYVSKMRLSHALVPHYSQTLPQLFGRSSFATEFPACGPKIGKNIYNPTLWV